MSTRSIIAKQHGDSWVGRYAHWDGYPSHQGASIWRIVQRDGWEVATRVLVDDHFYWSSLDPLQLPTRPTETRWEVVEGYGIAGNEEQASADEWYTPNDYKESWCEYVYVISKAGLLVIRIHDEMPLGFFRWNEPEPNWESVQNTPAAV